MSHANRVAASVILALGACTTAHAGAPLDCGFDSAVTVSSGVSPEGVALGDVDGDGDLDLAATTVGRSGDVSFWFGACE